MHTFSQSLLCNFCFSGVTDLLMKHPHERGEDGTVAGTSLSSIETPPRAWGRLPASLRRNALYGNTPTSVGKTIGDADNATRATKHPHERGEDSAVTDAQGVATETPPRAWGRLTFQGPRVGFIGNTPTSVGKTRRFHSRKNICRKHPHERGEDSSGGD